MGELKSTPDGRHSYEVSYERQVLDDMEALILDPAWASGEILDTPEENPRLQRKLEQYDELAKDIYGTDDPFLRMDEEEDWDDEPMEEIELKSKSTPKEKKEKLRKLKRQAERQSKLNKLTMRQQIARLVKNGKVSKEEARKLRAKYKESMEAEERGLAEVEEEV